VCNWDDAKKEPWAHLRLPPFSPVALRVLQLASKENVQLHELSQLISCDQALSSEILAIVNSLAYAPRVPVASILQAIAMMGANHLQGLCLTVAIRGYLGKSIGHPIMQGLWRHNMACATIAEQLAALDGWRWRRWGRKRIWNCWRTTWAMRAASSSVSTRSSAKTTAKLGGS
jgi:HD-like signal output (HDOD) protein